MVGTADGIVTGLTPPGGWIRLSLVTFQHKDLQRLTQLYTQKDALCFGEGGQTLNKYIHVHSLLL
jgi:hypothetical protein